MRNRFFVPNATIILILAAIPAIAQSNPLRGTWSGSWTPDGGVRDAVTVRFEVIDGKLTGEIVNPENVDFENIEFDASDLSLVAEAGDFRIEARIEEETRLNGTLDKGSTHGEMRLTKWTYVPRIR